SSLDVAVVPDGVVRRGPHLPKTQPGGHVTFLANWAYAPNMDAAHHLCADIWPRIHAVEPEARLHLVGANPPDSLRRIAAGARNVTVDGPVPDVPPVLAASDVVVCPLRIGGGVKVKMLEALASGCAIVTTSIGVQGLAQAVATRA